MRDKWLRRFLDGDRSLNTLLTKLKMTNLPQIIAIRTFVIELPVLRNPPR